MFYRLKKLVFLVACGCVLSPACLHAADETSISSTNAVVPTVPAWRLYDDPTARGDYRWMADFEDHARLIEQYGNKKDSHHGQRVTIQGAYSIPAPDESGRMVRIRFDGGHLKNTCLEFRSGSDRYQVSAEQRSPYYLTVGKVLKSLPQIDGKQGKHLPVHRIADDGGLWYAFADGLMDLRYERGQFIVARGPRVLVSFPVETAPTDMVLSGETRLNLFQVLNLPPLEPEQDTVHTPLEHLRRAALMPWRLDNRYYGREDDDPARLIQHDDGSVELFSGDTGEARSAEAMFKSESPMIITLKIHSASAGAGISVPGPNRGSLKYYIGKLDGKNVICREPYVFRELKKPQHDLHVLRSPFYCRVTYGLDFVQTDFGEDGRTWATYSRQALHRHHAVSPLGVSMLLGGARQRKKNVLGPEQRIRLSAVHVRTFRLLEGFVDPGILGGTPPDISSHAWRMACNWALINGWASAELRQKAAADFVETTVDADVEPLRILQSIRSLVTFLQPPQRHRSTHSPDLGIQLERLGERMLMNRKMDAAPDWLATWYVLDFSDSRRNRRSEETSPPPLIRGYLHKLRHEEAWEELRLRSLQYMLYSRPGSRNLLAAWMLDQAVDHLDDVSRREDFAQNRYWLHPLRVLSDRQTANLINEFLAATADGELERACRILIRGYDKDSLSVSHQDSEVYKPAQDLLGDLVRSQPELQKVLVEQFSQIGLIRVNRALEQGTLDQLEQIVVQFHGTEASRKALMILADRGLSLGQFARAADRYDELIPFAADEGKNNLIAKRNLALAMSGQRPAEPVLGTVSLPGGTFSADQYRALIESILKQNPDVAAAASPAVSPGSWPAGETPAMRHLMDLPFFATSPIAARQEGKFLLLQQGGMVGVIDTDHQRMAWLHGSVDLKSEPFSFRPLVLRDRVVAAVADEPKSATLKCFHLHNGNVIWERKIGDTLAADPFRQGHALFVLTRSSDEHLVLQRINLANGEPEFRQFLLRHHHEEKRRNVVRGIAIGPRIVISAAGMLICCDSWGELRWIRRMAFVPPDADPTLSDFSHGDDLIAEDGHIIVCSPGAPEIVCVDADTGSLLWSKFQPRRRHLLGLAGDTVLVRNTSSVEAIGMADGKTRWWSPAEQEAAVCRLDGPGKLLGIRFDPAGVNGKPEQQGVRRAVLLSATDGTEAGSWDLSRDVLPGSGICAAYAFGRKVLVLAGDDERKRVHKEPSAQLCVLE